MKTVIAHLIDTSMASVSINWEPIPQSDTIVKGRVRMPSYRALEKKQKRK